MTCIDHGHDPILDANFATKRFNNASANGWVNTEVTFPGLVEFHMLLCPVRRDPDANLNAKVSVPRTESALIR